MVSTAVLVPRVRVKVTGSPSVMEVSSAVSVMVGRSSSMIATCPLDNGGIPVFLGRDQFYPEQISDLERIVVVWRSP